MQRVFMMMKVKAGKESEYVRRHNLLMRHDGAGNAEASAQELELCRQTWKTHKDAGIKNYSIFLIGSKLYAYFEAEDYRKTLDIITKSEVGQKCKSIWTVCLNRKTVCR
ncbi:MAG: hypothetical protein RR389_08490 [Christensenella sp.]